MKNVMSPVEAMQEQRCNRVSEAASYAAIAAALLEQALVVAGSARPRIGRLRSAAEDLAEEISVCADSLRAPNPLILDMPDCDPEEHEVDG